MRSVLRCAAALALLSAAGAGAQVRYDRCAIEVDVDVEGEVIEVAWQDLEDDGVLEVLLVLRTPAGRRELRIHRIEAGSYGAAPSHVLDVLDEALAFGVAQVRAERGRELVFLTGEGTWSYSLVHEGYRGNVRRLTEGALLYDVPTPSRLPLWPYVIPHPGRDRLLLPGPEGYALWGAPAEATGDGDGGYEPLARFARRSAPDERDGDEDVRVTLGSEGMRITRGPGGDGPWLAEPGTRSIGGGRFDAYFEGASAYRAPAMVDLDGDGFFDLLASDGERVDVHRGSAARIAARPGRTEELPDYLVREDLWLWFRDLDGDGDLDLIAQCADDATGLEANDVSLLALRNDGQRLFPPRPSQVLRFRSHDLDVRLADVNQDGRVDLTLTEFVMPSLLETVAGVEIELTDLVYLGTDGARPFASKPILRSSTTYDEESIVHGIRNRKLMLDFDGDSLADWVGIDLEGRLSIHRTRVEEHFFSDDSWGIESSPWLRFDDFGGIESLEIRDLNGDGLGDVASRTERGVSFLLSQRTGGRAR